MEEAEPAARNGATPPSTDAQRLWRRYQLPEGKRFPDDRLPLDRYHWNLLILRLGLPDHIKAIAGALATLGNADGSNVVTTDPRLLAAFNVKERQLRDRIAVLHEHKLLHVVERPGGRGVAKTIVKGKVLGAIVCQLTEPADGKLPYRLDADFLPIEPIDERQPGTAPVAAIKANRTTRAANTGSATAAANDETPAAPPPQQMQNSGSRTAGVSDETSAAALPEQDQNTGSATAAVSDVATRKHRQQQNRSNAETSAAALPEQTENTGSTSAAVSALGTQNTGSAATAVSDDVAGNSGGESAAATPVDNPPGDEKHRQPQRRTSPETPAAPVPKHRQPQRRSNENPGTAAAGAASREEVLKNPTTKNPLNPTTRVVQLGGDLTSDEPPHDETPIDPSLPADEPEPSAPDAEPVDAEPQTAWNPEALAASFQPTEDPEYDDARRLVATVPPEDHLELFANAQAELEAHYGERTGSYDSAGTYTADHHQIIVRAAEIWRRIQAAGHAPATEGTES